MPGSKKKETDTTPIKRRKTKDTTTEIKVSPKITTVKDIDKELFIFRCQKKSKLLKSECGNAHFRHAGYIEGLVPYIKSTKQGKVQADSLEVKVCTKCKACYVFLDNQYYDVTKFIDLEAWEETEKVLHKATGPGGQC